MFDVNLAVLAYSDVNQRKTTAYESLFDFSAYFIQVWRIVDCFYVDGWSSLRNAGVRLNFDPIEFRPVGS